MEPEAGLSLPGLGGCGEVPPERPRTRDIVDPGPAATARTHQRLWQPFRGRRVTGRAGRRRLRQESHSCAVQHCPEEGAWPRLSLCHCRGQNATSQHLKAPVAFVAAASVTVPPTKAAAVPAVRA